MKRNLKILWQNECGGTLVEFAISWGLLIPIFLALAFFFFDFSGGAGSTPSGAIVERGEESLIPIKQMSPVRNEHCGAGQEQWCY